MRRSFLTLITLVLTFTTHAAWAGPAAEMKPVEASGLFEAVQGARVELNFAEGQEDPVSITVTLRPEGKPTTYPVWSAWHSGCGDQYLARAQGDDGVLTNLRLTDYSQIRCRMFMASKWHLSISVSGAGRQGALKLEGNPVLR